MRVVSAMIAQAVEACAGTAVWGLSDGELVAGLDELWVAQRRLAAVHLALVREVDGRGLAVAQGASSTVVWLRERMRMSAGAARRLV
ncbi:MAG TPA: HNH endonuclease, partial [Micromonosporaceae bacterium]|nr:HNH endonuclease [Micromonosporaceae bacterium]